jgi:hypothetical protein
MNEMLFRDKQNSQSGQALVEYILLLVIATAIIVGLAQQIHRPFGTWMRNYMGEYLECLLDIGELPTIGGSSASGECNSRFKKGTLANGRPPLAPQEGPGSSGANKNKGSNETSGGGQSTSAASNSGGRQTMGISPRSGADSPKSAQGDKQMMEKLPESQFFKNRGTGSYNVSSSRSSKITLDTWSASYNRKKKGSNEEKVIPIEESQVNGPQREAKKLFIKPTERKVANDETDVEWSFAQYIKFALIIFIIIAIVLFLGGQIAQISKSMEK